MKKRAAKKIIYWTDSDLKVLKKLAGKKSAREIATQLRRTEVAIRLKASQLEISLRVG